MHAASTETHFHHRGQEKYLKMAGDTKIEHFWTIMDELGITTDEVRDFRMQLSSYWFRGR
jgi:hypothetical protein